MRKFPSYLQHDAMDCGPTCVRIVSKYYGKNFSLKTLRERSFVTRMGVSMLGISDAAESIGFHTLGASLTCEQLLTDALFPCIAHWKQSHFVVVYKISQGNRLIRRGSQDDYWVHVSDPAQGLVKYKFSEFKKGWISTKVNGEERGHCLMLDPTPEFYNSEDETTDRSGFRYLVSYLRPYKKFLLQLVLGFLITSLFALITPFLTQLIVDKGVNNKDVSFLTLILSAQLALTIGSASIGFIRGWIMLHLTTRVNISLISNFLTRLMKLPISFFDNKMTGDLMQRIDDNGRIQTFLTSTALNIVFAITNFFIFSFVIASYDISILTVFLIGSIIYIAWARAFLAYRRELDNRRFAQLSNNQSNILQLIGGMQEIKLNNCERQKRWEWERIQASIFKISSKGLIVGQYQTAGALLINGIKNFTIIYLAATAVIKGEMTLGMMLSVQFIIGQLNGPVESLIGFLQSWQDAKISLERLSEIQDVDAEEKNTFETVSHIPTDRDIVLKNVCFQYDGPHSAFVLDDVSVTIPANKVTAIVGSSGSGKTTLIKLLLKFYQPTAGEIRLGPFPFSSVSPSAWRQTTGTVLQDGFIFSDTIANNISISDESPDRARLANAAMVANIEEFVERLPLGYNTKIGALGSGLSQGQKQRLLIARSVYKNPSFVFLDEATNSLDANNESTIMGNLKEFFKGRTVVVVAHRLSTVRNADNIIVLDKGRVIEEGTHTQLVLRNGSYYKLIKNQLELGV